MFLRSAARTQLNIIDVQVSELSPRDGASTCRGNLWGQKSYINPWPSAKPMQCVDLADALRKGADVCIAPRHGTALRRVDPQVSLLESVSSHRLMFIGHASVLLQIPITQAGVSQNLGVLFDPVFSKRCSPSQSIGPRRFVSVPLQVHELPPIHICCISHDHYDHLDKHTILDLVKHHGRTIHFFVPLGVKSWFASLQPGLAGKVTELDWFQEACVDVISNGGFGDSKFTSTETLVDAADTPCRIKVACTPAQHGSGRGFFDQLASLWCTWVIGVLPKQIPEKTRAATNEWVYGLPSSGFRCFFGGDTGLQYAGGTTRQSVECPAFQRIAELYGPPDIALLPISTGSSLSFIRKVLRLSLNQHAMTSSVHCSVEDALRLHEILGSKQSMGIHWGTFSPADEAFWTVDTLQTARTKLGIPAFWGSPGAFTVQDVGAVLEIGSAKISERAG